MKSTNSKIILALIIFVVVFFIGKPLYMQPNYDDGQAAPNFSGKNLRGMEFQLADLKGNYVLVDFWGSWCGPCIGQIPKLKKLHADFNGQSFKKANGFEIVSVAVEQSERRWPKAVKGYGLEWTYHTLDLATSLRFFDSPIAKDYGVKEVPTTFLLDEKGQIVGVNWSAEKISEYLKSKM
ncbi:MAG: thiol-disulfide isomerase/thioredoxin [Paraglaciecola sp.]|jgi:thiol-disulfide isomerase/thioredoxin